MSIHTPSPQEIERALAGQFGTEQSAAILAAARQAEQAPQGNQAEMEMSVGSDLEQRCVVLNFGKPISWLRLPVASARQILLLIAAHAHNVEPQDSDPMMRANLIVGQVDLTAEQQIALTRLLAQALIDTEAAARLSPPITVTQSKVPSTQPLVQIG